MLGQAVSDVKWFHGPAGVPEVGGGTPGVLFSVPDLVKSPVTYLRSHVAGLQELTVSLVSSEREVSLM